MPTPEPIVAVVIVNWNQRNLVLEAVRSFEEADYKHTLVIIVDNGSSDGSAESLKEEHQAVILIENNRNLGFARASNQGMEEALKRGADYVFFFNNDAVIAPDCIDRLLDVFEDSPTTGAAAPFIYYHNKPDIIWYGGGTVALWRGWIGHRFIRRKHNEVNHKTSTTDYITGCAFMIKSGILSEVGGFDTGYGMYSEDVDLSLRIREKGFDLKVVPDAKAYHRISASAGGALSPLKSFHRGRSMVILIKRWVEFWETPTLLAGGIIGGIFMTIKLILTGSGSAIFPFWNGIINGFLGGSIPKKYSVGESE